jgi:hypothetical protein
VQYSELTHYHLNQGSEFPDIKKLTIKVLGQMRGSLCGQMRIPAPARRQNRRETARKRPMRACGLSYLRACVKKFVKKFRTDFSPIFDELAVMQVG